MSNLTIGSHLVTPRIGYQHHSLYSAIKIALFGL